MGRSGSIPCSGSGKKGRKMVRWRGIWKKRESWNIGKNSQLPVLDYDRYHLSWKERGKYLAEGTFLCGITSYVFYRNWKAFLIFLPFGILFPEIKKKELKKKRKERLASEFKEGIRVLSSSLGAGYSIEYAFIHSAEELKAVFGSDSLIVREFSHIAQQLQWNRPVEELLQDFGRRSGLEDIRNFSQVFQAAKRSGGHLSSIMDYTAGIIRDKIQVQEDIQAATASRRMEQKVMSVLPYGVALYVDAASPGFFQVMYTTGTGRLVMTVCLGIYAAALVLADRILDIEV